MSSSSIAPRVRQTFCVIGLFPIGWPIAATICTTSGSFGFPAPDLSKPVPIVGLVNDVSQVSVSVDPEPAFYLPLDQSPSWRQAVVIETSLSDAMRLAPLIRAEVKRLDPQLSIEPGTVTAIVAATMRRQKLGMDLMILFGAIALGLACGAAACKASGCRKAGEGRALELLATGPGFVSSEELEIDELADDGLGGG